MKTLRPLAAALALALPACAPADDAAEGPLDPSLTFDPGTVEDRAALFDYLLQTTLERDAFASLPSHPLYRAHPAGLDVVAEMARHRDELLAAETDSAFYYAILKISNARRDRHLRISPVEGGLVFPSAAGVEASLSNSPAPEPAAARAPILLRPDLGTPGSSFLFVGDFSRSVAAGEHGPAPTPGDRVVEISGLSADEYRESVRPYHRYSTDESFQWLLAGAVTQPGVQFPRRFHGESLRLGLERPDGTRYALDLPYLDPADVEWEGHGERRYPGFSLAPGIEEYETFSLYLPDARDLPVVLLQWHGFEADLVEGMDRLMGYAEERGLLDHHVIVDATVSGGGSRGAYAVQRLQPRPFRTTFGNLKVSDGMRLWVEERIRMLRTDPATASESVDGGGWLLEWLEEDARRAIEEGRLYTNAVPFKLAHLPKWSDGIVEPAAVHFRGRMVVLLGPRGGSHLDQFASQVVDNGLAHVIGMPAGGYSNTWQYEEVLRFPTTGRPIAGYMWSMGHTLRPNGEILQYNPARVHEHVPLTSDNHLDYHPLLLARALAYLGLEGHGGPPAAESGGR